MKYIVLFFTFWIVSHFCFAQKKVYSDKYWIQFKDKNGSLYSLNKPQEFLSDKALMRRLKYNIKLAENDLPVSSVYIEKLKSLGLNILYSSKWMNGVIIQTNDSILVDTLYKLPFVFNNRYLPPKHVISQLQTNINFYHVPKFQNYAPLQIEFEKEPTIKYIYNTHYSDTFDYGFSYQQVAMLNGNVMHNLGYTGKGIYLQVQDAGFHNADKVPAFDSLWLQKRVKRYYDFVDSDTILFLRDDHGLEVLSCIASNIPGLIMGTAPHLDVNMMRTEDANSEYQIEEYNWLAAAELADSMGVDVINSSLGYTRFDDISMGYQRWDMDGNTCIGTQAADLAASKGILVVNSAGNSGDEDWHYIGSPADADSILSVGATYPDGSYCYFSSTGPTVDRRIKPTITAMGVRVTTQNNYGGISRASGTSFSSPIMAGISASLWQAHPFLNNMQIIKALQRSADQFQSPDSLRGYGLPDCAVAIFFPLSLSSFAKETPYFLSSKDGYESVWTRTKLTVFSVSGYTLYSGKYDLQKLRGLAPGFYWLTTEVDNKEYHFRMIK